MNKIKDVEAEDPLEIVGVVLDRPMDDAGLEAMARTFVEEFALMGWNAKRLRSMFRQPHYGGPHLAYERLGADRIDALVEEVCGSEEGNPDA